MADQAYLFKILILGDVFAGKTSLLRRFREDRFSLQYHYTAGLDYQLSRVEVAGKHVNLQIWDTSGKNRFRRLLRDYYRKVHGVLLVYDTTSPSSFNHMNRWRNELIKYGNETTSIMLVGNKCDELKERQVSKDQGLHYAEQLHVPFIEASAKSGANVNELFGTLAVMIYRRLVLKSVPSPSGDGLLHITADKDMADTNDNSSGGQKESGGAKTL